MVKFTIKASILTITWQPSKHYSNSKASITVTVAENNWLTAQPSILAFVASNRLSAA
jgi:hypothetical protein